MCAVSLVPVYTPPCVFEAVVPRSRGSLIITVASLFFYIKEAMSRHFPLSLSLLLPLLLPVLKGTASSLSGCLQQLCPNCPSSSVSGEQSSSLISFPKRRRKQRRQLIYNPSKLGRTPCPLLLFLPLLLAAKRHER